MLKFMLLAVSLAMLLPLAHHLQGKLLPTSPTYVKFTLFATSLAMVPRPAHHLQGKSLPTLRHMLNSCYSLLL